MRHNRDEVIARVIAEFELLDALLAGLSDEDWQRPLDRPESKDPWTVKDGVAHIIYWKANTARTLRRQRRPAEERGLEVNALNHRVYERWRGRSVEEVLAWHREVHADVLAALRDVPDATFTGRERSPRWPDDLIGHSAEHRLKDIPRALARRP